MAKMGRLSVLLTASTGAFNRSLRGASRQVEGFTSRTRRQIGGMASGAGRAFKLLGIGSVVNMGLASIAFKRAASDIDDLAKSSRKLLGNDGATGALAGIRKAAEEAGVPVSQLDTGLEKMLDTMGRAKEGELAAVEAMERVGLTAEDLRRMRPEDALLRIADGIRDIANADEKITAARGIFGRSGGGLVNLFNQGSGAIRAAQMEMQRFGQALSAADATNVENMNDSFGQSRLMLDGIVKQLVADMAPTLEAMSDGFMRWIDNMGGVGLAADNTFNFMVTATETLLGAVDKLIGGYQKLRRTILKVGEGGFGIMEKLADPVINSVLGGMTTEERLAQFPEHRKEQARKMLEESGGFQNETMNFGMMKEGFRDEAAEADAQIEGSANATGLKQRFTAFRQNSEAATTGANKESEKRLSTELSTLDALEDQNKELDKIAGTSAGQGSRLLTAFGGPGIDGGVSVPTAAGSPSRSNMTDDEAKTHTQLLRQIANNTVAPVAVAG